MDRRLRVPLLVAAALHGLVATSTTLIAVRGPAPAAGPRNVEPVVAEIELDPLASDVPATTTTTKAAPLPTEALAPPGAQASLGPAAGGHVGDTKGLGGGTLAGAGAVGGAPESLAGPPLGAASGAPEPAGSAGPGKPFPSLIDLSSPGKHAFILPQPKPSTSPEVAAQKKLDTSLATAAAAKDKELGLGPGGPVASAAHDVSIGSDAPDTGTATVDVETDASGMVTEVHLVESSDAFAWKKVAMKLGKRLATTKLVVPKGAAGVTVRVKITAAVKLPSGAAPGQPVTVHPKEIGFGGEFDLADIGQKPKRVVGVQILRETRK